jgi:hypothetical protein
LTADFFFVLFVFLRALLGVGGAHGGGDNNEVHTRECLCGLHEKLQKNVKGEREYSIAVVVSPV